MDNKLVLNAHEGIIKIYTGATKFTYNTNSMQNVKKELH